MRARLNSTLFLARAAVAMSALALLVALSGVTPADAVRGAARVLEARNADTVDRIHASRTPRAGRLYPLGRGAKFPASVLPTGAARGLRGPSGPQGLAGPPGPPSLASVRHATAPGVRLPLVANAQVEVARIDALPAGNWLLSWSATVDYGGPATSAWCLLRIGTTDVAAADASVGGVAGATTAAVITASTVVSQAVPFSVALRCFQVNALPAGAGVGLDSQHIVAIRADSIG